MRRFNLFFFSVSIVLYGFMVLGKEPPSPLYKYQHWAKNLGGISNIEDSLFVRKGPPLEVKACKGIDLNLEPAWDITTGSKKVIVAIIDDGFAYNHPNLKENIWVNEGESGIDANGIRKEINGIDDDGNGYIDDLHGFDFDGRTNDPNSCIWSIDRKGNGVLDCNYSHGTGALGLIGARPYKEFGIAGINWNVSMMPLKTNQQQGVGADRKREPKLTAEAIHYAVDNGAKVISWSTDFVKITKEDRKIVSESFNYAKSKGVLIVVAAGNDLLDMDNDRSRLKFPQDSDFENVIYIANVDPCGELVNYEKPSKISIGGYRLGSNYGKRVYISAPAEECLTTKAVQNGLGTYRRGGGTSNAAPMVSGVAALVLAANPKLDFVSLKDILCKTAKKLAGLAGKTYCEGIVDAGAAVALAQSLLSKEDRK